MTRFDAFIRNMILQQLHLYEHNITPYQSHIIDLMIKELYQNEKLAAMNVETRVAHLLIQYKRKYAF